jgi:tetratricopeptide (TPR) repeat protein
MRKIAITAALAAITTITFAQVDSSAIYLQKALDEKAKGRKMEVVKALEKAQGFNKNNPQIVNELATAYLDVRMLAKAREKFSQLETMGGATTATYKQLMNLNFNMRQFLDAVKYAQLVKKAGPAEKVDYILGRSYYEMDDLATAIPTLETAAKAEPENAEIPHLLATAYTNMQNFKQAIPYFQKAIALNPKDAKLSYEMALAYYGMNDDQNALKYMLEAGEKGLKKDNEYMQNLTTALMNAGKFNEGLEIMKQTLAKRPTDVGLIDMMAEACYDAGKYDDAINFYNKILAIDEKKADALYMMGMAYQKKGQVENGRALCDKAIAMDPKLRSLKTEKQMPGGF